MTYRTNIEAVAEHEFEVNSDQDGDPVSIRVILDPGFADARGLSNVADEELIRAMLEFLSEHQRVDELPTQIELEDVAAAYPEFEDHLRAQFSQ